MPCGSHALVASIIALAMPPASAACYWPVLRCCACGCMSLFADICKRSVPRPRARVLSRHCAEICTKLRRFRLARVWVLRISGFADICKGSSRPRACAIPFCPTALSCRQKRLLAPARVWVQHQYSGGDNLAPPRARARVGSACKQL